ncbi:histidine kinase [Burkholderia dolosa]|uniref:hypothetical protein n=1 Tax=Burkholderia dolosa TaxID=152500 RepID=UPI00159211E6|nr:hypothetical protein [Burkholderia dolosa]MBY4751863.1 hypothetical protein [Burkholderia dolosa]
MNFTTLADINSWLRTLNEFVANDVADGPDFMRPYHFATLAQTAKKHGIKVGFNSNINLLTYAVRMHLFEVLGQERPMQINEYAPAGRFHPLEPLVNEHVVQETAASIIRILVPGCDERRDNNVNSLEILTQELLGNCYAHSESQLGYYGLVSAQIWPKARKAQLAICDGGIGIRNSLSQNQAYKGLLREVNSCEFATRFEVTSKPGRGHSGYGLTVTKQLIQQNNGAFFLVSGNEFHSCVRGREASGTIPLPFDGTLIVFEWNTDIPFDVKQVYDSWPSGDGDDDDFDF